MFETLNVHTKHSHRRSPRRKYTNMKENANITSEQIQTPTPALEFRGAGTNGKQRCKQQTLRNDVAYLKNNGN